MPRSLRSSPHSGGHIGLPHPARKEHISARTSRLPSLHSPGLRCAAVWRIVVAASPVGENQLRRMGTPCMVGLGRPLALVVTDPVHTANTIDSVLRHWIPSVLRVSSIRSVHGALAETEIIFSSIAGIERAVCADHLHRGFVWRR